MNYQGQMTEEDARYLSAAMLLGILLREHGVQAVQWQPDKFTLYTTRPIAPGVAFGLPVEVVEVGEA
jgi:hypothetical protein